MDEPVRRINFFNGRLLTSADLSREQDYHIARGRRANRVHGWGVVEGLDVSLAGSIVTVSPGCAVDVLGREIVLSAAASLDARTVVTSPDAAAIVTVTWEEVPDGLLPSADPTAQPEFLFWLELPRISIDAAEKAVPPSLALALVTRLRRRGFAIDVTVRDTYRMRRYPPG